jgi:FkbM family methyltransferase
MKILAALMRRMPVEIRRVEWWWIQMYRRIGGGGFDDDETIDSRWPDGDQRPIRTRRRGFQLVLNLQAWPERRTYFSGTYFQHEIEMLFEAILRPADQFLDIGANIGMLSILASSLIGPEGTGLSFEPNPEVYTKLKRHFEVNKITNLEAVPCALGDRECVSQLTVPNRNSGRGSLAQDREIEGSARVFEVKTVSGRRYVERLDPARPTVVKIDVEGYEMRVLRGIEEVLDWPEAAFIIEVNESLLRKAGESPEAVFDLFASRGYHPYRLSLRRTRFTRTLWFSKAKYIDGEDGYDVLLVNPNSRLYRQRIAPLLPGDAEGSQCTTHGR